MKKKLFYALAIVLSLLSALAFGVLIPNRAALTNPASWDIHIFHGVLGLIVPLGIFAFLIETLFDREAFKKDVGSIRRYRYLLLDLVSRDVKTKYRRSVLGLLWSILNPLLMMLVLTAVFSNIIRVQVEGGFALFYLTGYLMFTFISEATSVSMMSIAYAAPLIKKVYLPKYIFPLEKCIFSLVNMLFSLIAFVIVFVVFAAMGKITPSFAMLLFPLPMIYVFLFAFGISLILSAAYIFFRDLAHIYSVILTVWMYASPIIYPIDILPAWLASVMRFNPLYHYITYFRDVMIYGRVPSLYENLICILFSVLFLALGILCFRKAQDKFVLYI